MTLTLDRVSSGARTPYAGGTIGFKGRDTGVLRDPKLVHIHAPLVPS